MRIELTELEVTILLTTLAFVTENTTTMKKDCAELHAKIKEQANKQ